MSVKQTSSPRAARDRDTEKRILDAAQTVFMRRGTAGARMQEIAEEARVNQALLHYYFRSKDGLAIAVFRETAGRLIPSALAILGSDDSLENKVERFVHLYIDTLRQNPFLPGYIIAELHHHPERLTALVSQFTGGAAPWITQGLGERLAAQIAERVKAGTMRPIAPEQLVVNLIALSVFPFLVRPMLHTVLGLDDEAFGRFLDERRAELPGFILNALRP